MQCSPIRYQRCLGCIDFHVDTSRLSSRSSCLSCLGTIAQLLWLIFQVTFGDYARRAAHKERYQLNASMCRDTRKLLLILVAPPTGLPGLHMTLAFLLHTIQLTNAVNFVRARTFRATVYLLRSVLH
jgi:hypothetical protein